MKKKFAFGSIIALITVLVMNCTLCFAYADTSSVSASDSKPIYLALGDSITYGYEPGDTAEGKQLTDECFVSILAKDKGYTAINEGVIGNTAAGVLQQLNSGEFDSTIQEASIITLTCGGNDLMEVLYQKAADLLNANKYTVKAYGEFDGRKVITILALSSIYPDRYPKDEVLAVQMAVGTAVKGIDQSSEFQEALSEFIDTLNQVTSAIKCKNPNIEIFVTTQYNPYEHFTGLYKDIGTNLGNCAKILRDKVMDNAATGKYTAVDVYTLFLGNTAAYGNATEDPVQFDFHPSVKGHAAIAKCFEEVVPDASEVTPPTPDDDSDSKDSDTDSKDDTNTVIKKTSANSDSSDSVNTPDTGDESPLWILLISLIVSTAALTGLTMTHKKYMREMNNR